MRKNEIYQQKNTIPQKFQIVYLILINKNKFFISSDGQICFSTLINPVVELFLLGYPGSNRNMQEPETCALPFGYIPVLITRTRIELVTPP